jgi:hypothetical protein
MAHRFGQVIGYDTAVAPPAAGLVAWSVQTIKVSSRPARVQ